MTTRLRVHETGDGIGRRVHECSICGKVAPWGPTWLWYGSAKDEDDGTVHKFCSRTCASRSRFGPVTEVAP